MQRNKNEYIRTRWRMLLMAVLPGLLLIGCDQQPQQQAPQQKPVRQVSTITVQTQKVVLTTELPGRTSAFRVAEIRPQVNGLLQKRLFEEGSDVEAGQPLYQIAPASFQAALDNAEASLTASRGAVQQAQGALKASLADVERLEVSADFARKNRQRYEALFREKATSANQRDQAVSAAKEAESALQASKARVGSNREAVAMAQANILRAEAAVRTARINLGYTKVAAPIAGRVGRSNVTEGAMVTAYQPLALATIQQLDPIYVDVPQSTTELLRLKKSLKEGQLNQNGTDQNNVKLILEDGTAYAHEGTLQFSDITVDSTTGSVILRAVFPNPDGMLLPGMFVKTVIREGIDEKAVLIPQQAVARNPRGYPMAWIVDAESKAQVRMLDLDRTVGSSWLISDGLTPGDQVIMEGTQMLRPGTVVKAVPFKEAQTQTGPKADAGDQPRKKSGGDA